MTEEHEKYVYFQECISSLNAAWSIIDTLQSSVAHKTLAWAAFRMALIEYAKPYKSSRGVHKRNHILPIPDMSGEDKLLHECIIDLRDKVLAHSDISVKNAKVYVGKIGDRALPLIVSNAFPLFPSLADVRGLVERSLDRLYEDLPELEARFNAPPEHWPQG